MKRRIFMLGALSLPAVSYFDMGASWEKHDNGLWMGINHQEDQTRLVGLQGATLSADDRVTFRSAGYYGFMFIH